MKITKEGLALIRRFEGFRAEAYRDPVGVWTIGYGHTSMAGTGAVAPGQKMSEADAAALLAGDVENFSTGVARLLKREISPQRFSALVSFAYTVGLGNFGGSSVLKAVNAGAFDAVPRRLQLWVKAAGRVLPGLVRRRAAEAALFASGGDDGGMSAPVEALPGKPALRSTTNLAALVSALAAVAMTVATTVRDISDVVSGPALAATTLILITGASLWIVRERRLKAADDGV